MSGRLAWEVARQSDSTTGRLILFERGRLLQEPRRSDRVVAGTRLGAFLAAFNLRNFPDLVLVWHLHLARLCPLISASRARKLVFLHGIESWRSFGWSERRALQRVDQFLCNSRFTWNRFVDCNPSFRDRSHRVVALGWGSAVSDESAPDPEPTVVMVSRLASGEDYKGHRELISAWPLVLRREPSARLWIVGEGDLRPTLESLARSVPGGERIRFWGQVSEEQKVGLIRRSRCLALPSRREGFGLVYLEAMRLGRPCLVSDQDAGREVVNPPEAGLAVDPADSEALAEAVCRLISPGREWSRWSNQSLLRHQRGFTAAHFQRRLAAALAMGPES